MVRKALPLVALALLVIYSAVLILAELLVSQQAVRPFVTDVTGPVTLYGVNTTLSTFLLWGTAVLFFQTAFFTRKEDTSIREYCFWCSQIVLFGLMGFDDRFPQHERLEAVWGVKDLWIFLTLGIAELGALFLLGRIHRATPRARRCILAAAGFFAVMVFVDGFIPGHWVPRLSVEDLSKTWAGVCLFLFGWEVLASRIDPYRVEASASAVS